jgi:hypothetical protein
MIIELSVSHRYVLLVQYLLERIQYETKTVISVKNVSLRAEALRESKSYLELPYV